MRSISMKQNMGIADRLIRLLAGAPALLGLGYLVGFGTAVGVIALVGAAVMVSTAAIGFCPLYMPLHFHTNSRQGVAT
jgi:Protein of unknown function (DUF2892)